MTYFNDAKRRSEAGVAKNCMATYGLSQRGNQMMSDLDIAYTLSTPFSAGVETVRRFLISCLGAANRVNGVHRRYQLSNGDSVGSVPSYEYFAI